MQNLVVSLRKNILEKDNYIEKIREELDTYGLVDNSGFDPEDDEFQGNSFANPKVS